jgi:Ca2+-binding RTX toxin-like protein
MAYSGVFVFGGSLVDGGNALRLAKKYDGLPFAEMPEEAPTTDKGYFEGRFSDGYTFPDLIANKAIGAVTKPVFPFGFDDPWLGLPISPFGGDPQGNNLNFAYGGAQLRKGPEVVPDLDDQTDAFKNAVDHEADTGALYVVTMGANDVRRLAPADSDPIETAAGIVKLHHAAETMLTELSQISNIGAKNFLITGIPDVGIIPRYDLDLDLVLDPGEQVRASAATHYSAYMDYLIRTYVVPGLENLGATVTYLPIADYADVGGQMIPGALNAGLSTIAGLHGLTSQQLSSNLLHYQDLVFFDDVHPTGQLHALVGSFAYQQLIGAPWVETLPILGSEVDYAMTGSISGAGEVDTINFALAGRTTYTFEMLGISSLGTAGTLGDTSLRLLDSTGTALLADDDSGAGLDARLSITTARNNTYSLELQAPGSLAGNYVFQAAIAGAAMNAGNVYRVGNASTLVLEPVGGLGVDVVATSVSYTLSRSSEIEVLKAAGRATGVTFLTGNQFSQSIIGNRDANTLDGKGGLDQLWGRGGSDTFLFSSALDQSVTMIKDFNARKDIIGLDDAVFGGSSGILPAEWFVLGSAASDPDDRIIFDPLTSALYYDPDGSGLGEAFHFATLEGANLELGAANFLIM